MDLDAQLDAIDTQIPAPVVTQALKRDQITIEDWAFASLTHGVIKPVTAGLHQVSGTARDDEECLPQGSSIEETLPRWGQAITFLVDLAVTRANW